ncbi:HNH endonuclease signature motif containing protein [Brachybacterium saurashtrense]|uniref:HNH endonuclease signature motif containing protein n=1 Tax=Brachybacterium saurashtrense TaxID=556288 RepID=UPI001FD3AF22|nr:HNH endonuclease signature motif containing protein [Brachybacterium saurashtrense]
MDDELHGTDGEGTGGGNASGQRPSARAGSSRSASTPDAEANTRVGRGLAPEQSLIAGEEVLRIGDVDVTAARAALAQLGAAGSPELENFTPSETIALLSRLQELTGAVAAVQARALVHLEAAVKEDSIRQGEAPRRAHKIARSEASMAMKQSKSCTGQSMASCRRLVHSMPGLLGALAHGRTVAASMHQVGRTMSPATPEQRALVDEILTAHLSHLEGCGPQEWGSEAERVLHALDPEGAAERHRLAKKERSVTVRRGEHGMCTLTARLTGLDGARIRKGLSIAAEKARAHGDRRGHQQIMADLFADALIGRGEGIDPSTLEVGVIITDRSLLVPGHADAATVEGYGAVPYEHIREVMEESLRSAEEDPELAITLRRLFTDEQDGQLIAAESRARAFPPALARFLRIAHQTCRAPYCDAAIRQNDHITPWADGGATSLYNGNGLCAADNQKEESGESTRIVRDEDGNRRTVEWTSRYGQKARRRGINLDPLGTGARLLDQERRRQRGAAHEADRGIENGTDENAPAPPGSDDRPSTPAPPRPAAPAPEGPIAPEPPEAHASDTIEERPSAHDASAERGGATAHPETASMERAVAATIPGILAPPARHETGGRSSRERCRPWWMRADMVVVRPMAPARG